jgi:hypothetical protein
MPPEILSKYLDEVEAALQSLKDCHFEKYEEEILTSRRANLRVRVRFSKGQLFELNEAVIVDGEILKHLSYRYHFQDKSNQLIFRYDNTPHFPKLETFPHHKHLPKQVIAAEKPSVTEIIREIVENLPAA